MNNYSLTVSDLKSQLENEPLTLIDVRAGNSFLEGFIPGSISAGQSAKYDKWIMEHLVSGPIVLVADAGGEDLALKRFQKLGSSGEIKILEGGFDAWKNAALPIDMVIDVEADELALDMPHDPNLQLIDLRGEEEYEAAHVTRAQHIPLAELTDLATIANFEEGQQLYLYCGGGQRSLLAASLFKRQGLHNLRVVTGGFEGILREKSIPVTEYKSHT